jgi:hypothetical protein
MKSLQLYDAYYYLKRCTGVLLEGRFLEPLLSEIEDDYESEFLLLEWEDFQDGQEVIVSVGFKEGDNQTIGLDGSTLILTNSDGEEEELTLLMEWDPLDFLKIRQDPR